MTRHRDPAAPSVTTPSGAPETVPDREEVEARFRWDVSHIFPGWNAWEAACEELAAIVDRLEGLRGTLGQGPDALLEALDLSDQAGELAYAVWYYPSLQYDVDQRDNSVNARRQRVQALFARWEQARSWFRPELLSLPEDEVRRWLGENEDLALYRFELENLFRRREHVLGEEGERVLSFASRYADLPDDAYSALSVADMDFPEIELHDGTRITVTYGKYRALLATNRHQPDRAAAFEALYDAFAANLNTYAALYNGVCQRDWFDAAARNYETTLEAALDPNRIPVSVVEELVATTRDGVGPLQRYHRIRKRALGLEEYHLYDGSIPLLDDDRRYPFEEARDLVLASVEPLGPDYRRRMAAAFEERWIDVYENEGKRSGAYSAGVYGVHPYILLNYNDTLDDLFTLSHELGHALHSLLSHESQPFTYAAYTIFVAEVASTLNEALLLEHLLETIDDPAVRVNLLQHAIDSIAGTFYSQVLFAEWELAAHRRAEGGEPITADILSELYFEILSHYYGEAVTLDDRYRMTWARIPHFFRSPYYVYQYATSFAASAEIFRSLRSVEGPEREELVSRYLELLRSGGNDYPIEQLRKAGVDLTEPGPVRAVVAELDRLVDRLDEDLEKVG